MSGYYRKLETNGKTQEIATKTKNAKLSFGPHFVIMNIQTDSS